jgi:hypothetical protein
MRYTAESFGNLWKAIDKLTEGTGVFPRRSVVIPNGEVEAVLAALRIAARVMEPEFLEDALRDRYDTPLSIAEDVREALTHPKEGT